MCGFVGVVGLDDTEELPSAEALERAGAVLSHRGPDDSGVCQTGRCLMAHKRLAILDVSAAGRQPLQSTDGRYALVFNGEIYNFEELRERYLPGTVLRSRSDSEVLLELLITQEQAIFDELRGMYAFALWDREKEELLLARDPLGKKPLYVSEVNGVWSFASEVKSLVALFPGRFGLDETSLASYLAYEYVPAPKTGWAGVEEVPMGQAMLISKKGRKVIQDRPFRYQPKSSLSEKKALHELDALLAQAVERRFVSDVPVGIFLSGGLDSSTILWYARQLKGEGLLSYSVGFEDDSFNESPYARTVAESLQAHHNETDFTLQSFRSSLPQVVEKMDIPLGDASLLPTFVVSELAAQDVKVVLDGDGSDELFGGYGVFAAATMADTLDVVPASWWRRLEAIVQRIPVSHRYFSLDFIVKSFVHGLGRPWHERHQVWLGSFDDQSLRQLLRQEWQPQIDDVYATTYELGQEVKNLALFDRISYLSVRQYLHNDILVKLDRATMMCGLEARTPFLDVDVVDFVMTLPVAWKREKYLLKKLMEGRLPAEIVRRKKQGFAIPIGRWLQGPLQEWMRSVLDQEKLQEDGFFEGAVVNQLMNDHVQGRVDARKQLWTLLVWQLWYDYWVAGRGLSDDKL